MKVLLLSRYDTLGASSRVRTYQYIPYLKKANIDITISPLFSNKYLEHLYKTGTKKLSIVVSSYFKRLLNLVKVKKYDILWIEKELFPMLPAWMERLIAKLRIPYIVDYDDAIFHNYDLNRNLLVRMLLRNKIDVVMRNASVVVVGNDYLAERAKKAGAQRIEYLPSVVDINRYKVKNWLKKTNNNKIFKIGWIGTPMTSRYLWHIYEPLKKFSRNKNIRLILVGANKINLPGIPVEIRDWNEEKESENIQEFDVGIMPLPDEPWERGKCGFKLIQYMACGVPVIGSPVGINQKIIIDGVNGFKATTDDEWVECLEKLYNSIELRKKMGLNGRKIVEENFSVQVTAPKLIKILESVS